MPVLFIYLLKLSLSLGVVYLFYHFILQKLTFYNSNRWYLLGYTLVSFLIPFINISSVLQKNNWDSAEVVNWVPAITTEPAPLLPLSTGHTFSSWDIVVMLLVTGVIIMLTRLLVQLFSFRRIRRNATVITKEGMNLYQVDENIMPFSFGNSIFINRHLHNENELEEIIRHEFVHVKQRHSLDILWGEMLCLLNWFNPFAWLLKRSIRQNLEFIADNKVLANGFNKKQYQYLLLKVTGNNQFSIASQFNFSSLKKRIAMMNKTKSTKRQLLRLLFLLPATAVLLLAFRSKWEPPKTANVDKKTAPALVGDVSTQKPPANRLIYSKQKSISDTIPPTERVAGTVVNKVQLSKISSDFEINSREAIIHLKDGAIEKYDLTNAEQRKKFETTYGQIITLSDMNSIRANTGTVVLSTAPLTTINLTTPATTTLRLSEGRTLAQTVSPATVVSGTQIEATSPEVVRISPTRTMVDGREINYTVKGTTILAPPPVIAAQGVSIVGYDDAAVAGKEEILVTITRKTTRQELDDFKKQMKEKGIDLDYVDVEYNEKGILVHISGTLDSRNGKSNFVATDFEKLTLSTITNGEGVYFKVRVKNKEVI